MRWANAAPPRDTADYHYHLSPLDEYIASRLIDATRGARSINIIEIMPSILQYRGLGGVVGVIPEVFSGYGLCTGHQNKGVVIVDPHVQYEIPYRMGNLRVKPPNWNAKRDPHIAFVGNQEEKEFLNWGTATILFVVIGGRDGRRLTEMLPRLAKGVRTGRYEKVVIVRDAPTTGRDHELVIGSLQREGLVERFHSIS